jgi:capsular polysaccharide biosynthesis protein
MATPPPPAQLTDIAAKLRRHWPVVVMVAVAGLVLGVLASIVIPATYSAESSVSVNPMSSDASVSGSDSDEAVSMPTEQQVVTSRKVAEAAAKLLAPQYSFTASDVQAATSASTPADSLILNVTFTGDTPQQAAAGANAVSEAYLTVRRTDASAELDRLAKAATSRIDELQARSKQSKNADSIQQRSIQIQVDALATQLASLGNVDLNPGQVIGDAEPPTRRSSPGPLPLGVAGALLGLLLGIPLALSRREEDTEIGGVEGLASIGDQIVLDGTKDTNRADTWDIAAFMLKIPQDLRSDAFIIMVDAEDDPNSFVAPGQELVDALARRGRPAHFVDAGGINEGKISRGWPTDKKRTSWAGGVVVLDTTSLGSDANKVALATRSDSVVLARSTTDDAAALRRLAGLFRSKNVDIGLTALFPPRPEMLSINR